MKAASAHAFAFEPVIRRLDALARLDGPAMRALEMAVRNTVPVKARQELLHEGDEISQPLLMVSGWAARTRCLEDGRRQIIDFVLHGDPIGFTDLDRALAPSTIVALTRGATCIAPNGASSRSLAQAYAVSRAMDEALLLGQITRLGRLQAMNGYRICCWS